MELKQFIKVCHLKPIWKLQTLWKDYPKRPKKNYYTTINRCDFDEFVASFEPLNLSIDPILILSAISAHEAWC
ncbi:MAG: hypothetical protein CMO37_00705 [Verrucomicrobiaceae bacterium]|nr:hypothetical protein [Verrucomicrobiaceae bacterium]